MQDEGEDDAQKVTRGRGRGSNFFALGRPVWEQLWSVTTTNRLNLITAYLVLLAGTGADHRLTKWSAKACEEHAGLGKPRAKHAISELIAHGMIELTDASTRLAPQYRLPELPRDADPIFLPVQLVTGLGNESPILKRVRETGDEMLLRMLIDLYALVQLDATYGVPIGQLRESPSEGNGSQKVFEMGVHALWALNLGGSQNAQGDWAVVHRVKAKANVDEWRTFWDRVAMLKKIGALWFEPWIFAGESLDAEPLIPVDLSPYYAGQPVDETTELTRSIMQAAMELAKERSHMLERYPADVWLPLPVHHQAPALRGVARLRVEPDTPGRRLAFARRMQLLERHTAAFDQLFKDATADRFDRPLRFHAIPEVA